MDALSRLYLPGALSMWCAVFFALAAFVGYARLLGHDSDENRRFARRAYKFFALSIVMASAILVILLLRRDFRIEYVFQYSGLELPWYYQLAAFWAGQKGSFLIWLLWGALIGIPLYRTAGKREEAPVMGVYLLTLMGLLFILVRENPFVMLTETPADGQGLNPLLQDNWMVIHPPIMFVGYALSAVPFSFGVAAMWRRRYDRWAYLAFPWALAGFMILGAAILLGGYWAYKTLGWGGYWGWDPVENASLIPWLFGTVLIHGLHMERRRGRYRRANLVFAALVYLAVLYGTFLTRSGVLADFSVHSFVDLGISGWLIALMAFFGGTAVWLLATRLRTVPTEANVDPFLSRGSLMVLGTITITVCAVVVTLGTSAPLLTSWMESPGQVGPEFYNQVNLPIALLVAILLAAVPPLTWRGAPADELLRKIAPGAVAGLVVAIGAAIAGGVHSPMLLLFVFLAATALFTNLQRTIQLWRSSGMKTAGGYLSHVGVGIILLGIVASSAYDESVKVTLDQGTPRQVGDLTVTFERFIPRQGREKERMELAVVREDGSRFYAYPKMFVHDRTQQIMVNPSIRSTPLQDLYISPIEFDPGSPPGGIRQVALTKGESTQVGDVTLAFREFQLDAGGGNAMAQMASGQPVSIAARLDVQRAGAAGTVTPVYRFAAGGQVERIPGNLPGGGQVVISAIDATSGAVQLEVFGAGGADDPGVPARLSVDITRKPLIQLVWFGLYVILLGGAFSMAQRLGEAFALEESKEA